MSIKFCTNCIYPSTKPDLEFTKDGLCQGCVSFNKKIKIDWSKRRDEFKQLFIEAKKKNSSAYDCVVPVSGGKDSTYQVLNALEYDLNPLCVTATTDKFTQIGKENLETLKKLGVDHIQISPDSVLKKKINKFTLKTVGDISWTEHVTIYTIPTRVALNFKIPFVLWGENPHNDYGGLAKNADSVEISSKWHSELGGLLGLRVNDLISQLKEPEEKFFLYTYPSDNELKKNKIRGIFTGYFFKWNSFANYEIAKKHGFKVYEKDFLEGSMVNYENLDNAQMRIHDYFKYLKYGYDRVTDWCCVHIRHGKMTRDEAIKINYERSGKYPKNYMGYSLKEILNEIDCTIKEFDKICDDFTNKQIFKCDNNRKIIKRDDKSLIINANP